MPLDANFGQKAAKFYLNAIQSEMPEKAFRRVPMRLLWLPFHLIIVGFSWWVLLTSTTGAFAKIALVILIGHSFGCLMFVGHELLHESILKKGPLQTFCASICLLPYWFSPEQWRTWHNHWHHRQTSLPALDPDAWGNLDTYIRRKEVRFVEPLSPGSGTWRSAFFFSYWFGFQGLLVLTIFSRLFHYWDERERRRIWLKFAACGLFWLLTAIAMGFPTFIFAYLLPMAFANAMQMAYVSTNHLLMPETKDCNDPLLNTLSLRTWWVIDFFHLNFSHHIEHHVAPSMSPRYATAMKALLKQKFNQRYNDMPHLQALKLVCQTPKLHWDADHLVNPRTGEMYRAIGNNRTLIFLGTTPLPVPRPRKSEGLERDTRLTLSLPAWITLPDKSDPAIRSIWNTSSQCTPCSPPDR